MPRSYLGASRLGAPCERALQYEYAKASVDEGRGFSGRTLRIFEVGHIFEDLVIRWLRLAGFELHNRKANGDQFGFSVAGGRLKGHVDLRAKQITGKDAEQLLGQAHITCNKNAIPNDPEKPFVTSGIRLGSPAMTTRGFTESECEQVGHLIADVLDGKGDASAIEKARHAVHALTARFPVYR
ncbi:MAG: hypothetical protein EBW47_10860 [Betaproteobacteria bacterium]|nr:hypothetical protein [Betaproteobacteria bacterium]